MPKMSFRGLIVLMVLAVSVLPSCKKTGTPAPITLPVNYRIRKVVDSEVYTSKAHTVSAGYNLNTTYFSYNEDSTVRSIRESQVSRSGSNSTFDTSDYSFAYFKKYIIKTPVVSRSLSYNDTFYLDSTDGKILSTRSAHYLAYHPGTDKLSYSNTTGRDYTWKNDNIWTGTYRMGDTSYYEYYEDKTIRHGDGIQLSELKIYGRAVTRNKNLIKSINQPISASPFSSTYTYDIDSYGRITGMTSAMIYSASSPYSDTIKHFYKFSY